MRIEQGFKQVPFLEQHPYLTDPVLPALLKRLLPSKIRQDLDLDLNLLGNDLTQRIRPLASLVQPATLTQYNQWGQRIDTLHTSEGWRKLEQSAIREGYISIAHTRQFDEHSRTYMFAKAMLMTGDYHVIMCPLGMTDGAASVIRNFGTDEMIQELYPKLTSRDPDRAYLSGQWMTERPGGSDVSQTETKAKAVSRINIDLGPPYVLNGFKWFSSAAEGNIALALARTSNDTSAGSRGLSLFVVPLRTPTYPSPLSNGVHMHRLKNKIGTWGVPTAELSLESTRAWLIGPINGGVKTISTMLTITRVHSAIHSLGSLRRCLSIARAYSTVRTVEGGTKLLRDVPLHVAGLADVNLLYRALAHFTFGVVVLLGKSECGVANASEEARLRLLTPVVKAFNAEKAPSAMEEAMAALGGLGYMEEVGIGRLIRDSLVEKIWEGTINVLALDLDRAINRKDDALKHYLEWASQLLLKASSLSFDKEVISTLTSAVQFLPLLFQKNHTNPLLPRLALNIFATVTCSLYLLEHATWALNNDEHTKLIDMEVFCRWVMKGELHMLLGEYEKIISNPEERSTMNSTLVFGVSSKRKAKL